MMTTTDGPNLDKKKKSFFFSSLTPHRRPHVPPNPRTTATPRIAHACTEIILKDKCTPGGAVVSSRTLSFPASFGPEVAFVRKGAKIALLETSDKPDFPVIDGKSDTKKVEAKYDFVCASVARNELAGYYGANSTRGQEDWM